MIQQFSTKVVRYVDLMEQSIVQSIERGFARERWEVHKWASSFLLEQMHVLILIDITLDIYWISWCGFPSTNYLQIIWYVRKFYRDGCATSEDTYWKLDALQIFIHDLNWPEEEFSKYLQIRMKALTSEMINKCTNWYVWSWTEVRNMVLIYFYCFLLY